MNEETTLLKTPRISIVPMEEITNGNFEKYLGPSDEVKLNIEDPKLNLNSLIFQIKNLQSILGSLRPVNWLRGWGAFRFDNMTAQQIADSKRNITIWVRGVLAEQDATTGASHTVSFNWVDHTATISSLEAYLNPPAVIVDGPGGGTSGTVSPNQPTQPPPPSL